MRRLLLIVLATTACLPAAPTRRPPAPLPVPVPAAPSANTGPWRSHHQGTVAPFHLETIAYVSIAGDGPNRTDTLHAVLEARAAQLPGNARRWDGDLTAYAVAVNQGVLSPVPGLVTPARFSAELGNHFRLPTATSICTDPALSIMQSAQEALIVLPDSLRLGQEWSDSLVTTSCRDRIPLSGTTARRFRVLRAEVRDGRTVLVIERTAKSVVHGAGDQFGEKTELAGSGEGAMTYLLDAETSRWLSATGTSTLSLTFKSARRSQRVTQSAALSLVWAR